ncbi:hypothetical protein HS99_0039885 [Kitasatospora aureofaciens]|uniref:Uncharacterized protein n=1 Tax=Kitasatospora aureofaciens TaxID=1894 RepID=A0A1E7MWN2_KITAU|nr:hypothetical protein HS99_0039885 [Kitasatospora aureofaciens]
MGEDRAGVFQRPVEVQQQLVGGLVGGALAVGDVVEGTGGRGQRGGVLGRARPASAAASSAVRPGRASSRVRSSRARTRARICSRTASDQRPAAACPAASARYRSALRGPSVPYTPRTVRAARLGAPRRHQRAAPITTATTRNSTSPVVPSVPSPEMLPMARSMWSQIQSTTRSRTVGSFLW